MADIRPELDFALYRTIDVGDLPDPDWASTFTLPDNTVSIRQFFPSDHGFLFTLVLRDVGGAKVAPGTMTYTARYYAILDDGTEDIANSGFERALLEPFQAVVENTIGFGRYAVGIVAVANVPVAVDNVQIWIKEI